MRSLRRGLPLLACLLFLQAVRTRADEYTHRYSEGDAVRLWVNKVGPYNNPQETCAPHVTKLIKKINSMPQCCHPAWHSAVTRR